MKNLSIKQLCLIVAAFPLMLLVSEISTFAQFSERSDRNDAGYLNDSFYDNDWFYDYTDTDSFDTDYYKGDFSYDYDKKDFKSSLYDSDIKKSYLDSGLYNNDSLGTGINPYNYLGAGSTKRNILKSR